jgi:DNA helicase-2/ATP-dependent DNA helicase PcrA
LRRPGTDPAGVTLATVHRVKGQEWPVVVVHHADDQQFPHRLAEDDEEERRVFHVALTRAKERALVVATTTPTPFLAELLTDPPAKLLAATRPVAAREAPRPAAASSGSRSERDSLFRKGTVLAVPGQVLADQGQQWQIVSIDAVEARATSASSRGTRAFRLGSSVVTAGGRRGKLQTPTSDDPSAPVTVVDDQLRVARRALAAGKPAFTVISDATIEAIAVAQPRSLDALAAIKGIGPRKLEDYGDALLAAVAAGIDAAG